jgi:tetratricopeptide (TPR) repeat protein
VRAAAAFALGAVVTVTPVALRNLHYGGELALVGYNGGMNFYIGNGPGAIGTFRIPPETPTAGNIVEQHRAFAAVAERDRGRALSSRQVDRYWYARTLHAIAAHPRAWLRLVGDKLALYFADQELANNSDYSFTRRLNPILALPLVGWGALAPLALLGTLLLVGARRPEEQLVALCNVVGCVAVVAFFVIARYRIAAVPAAVLAALAAARWIAASVRARRWRLVAPVALLLALGCVATFARTLPEPIADEYFKLGYAYQIQEQPDAAERAYLSALAFDARQLSAHKNLAVLYESRGDVRRAVVHWQWVYGIALERGQRDVAELARARLAAWGQPARSPLTPTEIPPKNAN